MKLNLWYAAAAVIAAGLLWQTCRADGFEKRAKAAEAYAERSQRQADSLRVEATWAETQARKIDTVVLRARATVAHVDSISPPDSSCLPNLDARDKVILAQADEIDKLKVANDRLGKALAMLQGAKDTLSAALASRPHYGKIRLRGPSLGPAVWLFPGELRVGVSLQLGGIGL